MIRNITYYYDLSKVGKDYIGKRDIAILTNEQAVLESIVNIISTEPGDRVMNPLFGCPINKYLFEPLDEITSSFMQKTISDSILRFENRLENLEVTVTSNEDQNSYSVNIIFSMKTSNSKQTINITLNKLR
jgi:phage baseplate assembly protein W